MACHLASAGAASVRTGNGLVPLATPNLYPTPPPQTPCLNPIAIVPPQWPASGEIDMVESRGNDASYPSGGANCFASTLHWGPYFPDDPYDLTTEQYCADSGNLSDDFHTYGLVWSKDEMYTYIDSEDNKVLSVPINESFWTKGGWDENPDIDNPWLGQGDNAPVNPKLVPVTTLTPPTTQTHSLSAPFANDQPHTC
mmetsp:Transcript_6682/g.15905  ORF Transcript_6682/g.15905 Transcript_6682/m.15905 type:complete len:197 (+) Transcript_6682:547-1137(+)